ncbi:MAG TPA: Fic family protein [Spirochaetota bacterium]|nr:Fic family protein [Spirochaetota bacterium]HPI88922.1 Fic family protein [Spirochaetota bacterium]HPR46601.1 Fic family protein [Spirochaetota bacterium]
MRSITEKYPHIKFKTSWEMKPSIYYMLGECGSFIKAIKNTPVRPDYLKKLHSVALVKGAQATTAIEGNTLTVEDIEKIQAGDKLPPSKEYLQIEVENILEAFNKILKMVVVEQKTGLIGPELLKSFHKMVGKNLGEHFEAAPGKFRNNNVIVGNYRAPDSRDVETLVGQFCDWMRKEFNYENNQTFIDAVLQAVVAHLYIAWIHPFSDGNGRTARLLEFYLLLRAGVPDIASHVLSNFYNITRSEYYRQIEASTKKRDITGFILYAVQGFRDGLEEVLETIQENQLLITWKNYIYGIFESKMTVGKTRQANKRRRNLILNIPHDRYLSAAEIMDLKSWIMKEYSSLSERSFLRDLEELVELGLLEKNKTGYRAKMEELNKYMSVQLVK